MKRHPKKYKYYTTILYFVYFNLYKKRRQPMNLSKRKLKLIISFLFLLLGSPFFISSEFNNVNSFSHNNDTKYDQIYSDLKTSQEFSTVRVAILNATSSESPAYFTGSWTNDYSSLYNGLLAAGITTFIYGNDEIIAGYLTIYSIDVLILIDNAPSDAASSIVLLWAQDGGSVISFDSSICFLNWAGFLPPEAGGTNGYLTYWDYNSPYTGKVVNDHHPIMEGYNYNDTIYGMTGDAQYFSDMILPSLAGPYYTPLVKSDIGSNYDLVAALNAPYCGRVVHHWDYTHWNTASNRQMILNAILWAGAEHIKNYIMRVNYPFTWVDASGGTELLLSLDGYTTISLPFTFTFYGKPFSTIYLGANGYLSFTDSSPSDYTNDAIPSSDFDNFYLIAPFWDDLNRPAGGHIYVQDFGTYWVAEWLDIVHYGGGEPVVGSFEVILYQSGDIVFNYDYISYTGGGYTCGLNLGVDTQYYNSFLGLVDGIDDLSILFTQNIMGPVAIFRDALPWGFNSNAGILSMYNVPYAIYNSLDFGLVDLSPFQKVIIESDQPQTFYNRLGGNVSWFENYASNGGILEVHACDGGNNLGYWDGLFLMPGGLDQLHNFPNLISINIPSHPTVLNPHVIPDNELDNWGASAHGSFDIYPVNSKEILLDSNTLNPVLVEIPFGDGYILASMQTLEWGYGNAYSEILENIILYDPFPPDIYNSITVTSPQSYSLWGLGTSEYIEWDSIGYEIDYVDIELYEGGSFKQNINIGVPNNGLSLWNIPTDLNPSDFYQIKITDTDDSSVYYFTEYFEINYFRNYSMWLDYPYKWKDASGGTELLLTDDGYTDISLSFNFPFYDETFSIVYVSANGYLSFGDSSPSDYSNDAIPSSDSDNHYLIAPFWDDLRPESGGGSGHIYVQDFGDHWVVEWLDIWHYSTGPVVGTFEVILYQSGDIVFNYDNISYTGGGYTCGLNLGRNTAYYNSYQGLTDVTDDFSIRFAQPIFSGTIGEIAIFRDAFPWGYNVTEKILNMYNIPYTIYNSLNFGSVDLSPFQKVIITSDQPQTFYDRLGGNVTWFENYAANGGILEVHGCDGGWNGGYWDGLFLMPGGLDQNSISTDLVSINLLQHPIISSPFTISDAELDYWDSSAHGSFDTYPLNSKEILLDSNSMNPVFVEIHFGDGYILASMQTLEWGYGSAYCPILENILLYFPEYSITVINPNVSSIWEKGSSYTIEWDWIGYITNVDIELYKDGIFELTIVSGELNDGSYTWEVPTDLESSDQYQIKIIDSSDSTTFDFSDFFEIKSKPSGPHGIPGYNSILLAGAIIGISIVLIKKKLKKVSNLKK
jgi:hypothetical protein